MVIISFASIFFLLAALSSLSFPSPVIPRDFNQFQIDLTKLSVDVGNLTKGITSVGDGTGVTIVQETAVYNLVKTVQGDLADCLKDVAGLSVTPSQANTTLDIINGIVPGVVAALQELVAKEPVFAALYISVPVIRAALVALNSSVLELGATLITLAPDNLKPVGQSIENQLEIEFAAAIKAYSPS